MFTVTKKLIFNFTAEKITFEIIRMYNFLKTKNIECSCLLKENKQIIISSI